MAKKATCTSNLKQSTLAANMYADNNNQWFVTYETSASQAWWRYSSEMHKNLGFTLTESTSMPGFYGPISVAYRKITVCPTGVFGDMEWYGNYGYGTPIPEEYIDDKCEVLVPSKLGGKTETTLYCVNYGRFPSASTFALFNDSTFTEHMSNANNPVGSQAITIWRNGDTRQYGFSTRHNGVGNIGFADGHVGDSTDRRQLYEMSRIGTFWDAAGYLDGDAYEDKVDWN